MTRPAKPRGARELVDAQAQRIEQIVADAHHEARLVMDPR